MKAMAGHPSEGWVGQKAIGKNKIQDARFKMQDSRCRSLLATCNLQLITFILLFAVVTGCGGPQNKQPTVKVGTPAPAFALNLVNGGSITLDSFKGKPMVITFMASWCPCSNESAPVFKEAYRKYNPKGVEFLMIGVQDSQSKFKNFVDKKQLPFPAGFDKGDKIARLYGVNAPPTTFFIGRDGKIARAFYGKLVEIEKLSAWVEEIVKDRL
ncbi:MAG: TlpA family protein disulfide reductase [Deltaproteobacteria bacterium]|nr:TlpA family protein disulfide reductase [Deltaproteobacteria bacterium]